MYSQCPIISHSVPVWKNRKKRELPFVNLALAQTIYKALASRGFVPLVIFTHEGGIARIVWGRWKGRDLVLYLQVVYFVGFRGVSSVAHACGLYGERGGKVR